MVLDDQFLATDMATPDLPLNYSHAVTIRTNNYGLREKRPSGMLRRNNEVDRARCPLRHQSPTPPQDSVSS